MTSTALTRLHGSKHSADQDNTDQLDVCPLLPLCVW